MPSLMMNEIKDNYQNVLQRIREAEIKSNRQLNSVELIAVSKTHPREAANQVYDLGQRIFGENRVQEALSKFSDKTEDVKIHLIGHLQRNKAKKITGFFDLIHSVDTLELAEILHQEAARSCQIQPILLQVNTSGEISKSGIREYPVLEEIMGQILSFPAIKVRGLMTIGPLTDSEHDIRKAFSLCREWLNKLKTVFPEKGLKELSMGMTADLEWAVEEGSTMVRIGSAIFGHRDYM